MARVFTAFAFSAPCLHRTTNGRRRPLRKSVFQTAAVKFTMDIFIGVLALVIGVAVVLWTSVAVVRSLRTHRRDVRIVDMLNGGRSVPEIAQVLNTTERDVQEARKRIAGAIGPKTAGP